MSSSTYDKSTSRTGLVVMIVVIALAVTGWAVKAFFERVPDEVKIGVSQPFTGSLGRMGKDLLNGAQLAADEINGRGGALIAGKRVKISLVSVDDKSDPETGKAAARQLVEGGVVAAIANLNSGVSIPAAPIYAKAGIPQLAISTNPKYTRLGHPTTLRLVANDDMQARAMGSFALQLGDQQRIAIVDDGTTYGKGLAEQVSQVLASAGRKLSFKESLSSDTATFGSLVQELANSNTDLLITTMSDFQVVALANQLNAAGLSRISIMGGDMLKTDLARAAQQKVAHVYATSPILEPEEFREGRKFLAAFRARYGGEPVYGAHYAYDAIYLVADALSRNGSVDTERLLKRLREFDGNAPVTSMMRFDASGEQRYPSVSVYRLEATGWEPMMRSDRW